MMETMGERLRRARRSAGYSSAMSAAKALGISASTYTAHENGQNNFGPEEALHYGKKFGVTAAFLLTGEAVEGEPSLEDQDETALPARPDAANGTMFDNYSSGERGQKIPEIDVIAGMGGGGLAATEVSHKNGISFHSEVVRAEWELPSWVLQKMKVRASNVACFPAQGDSMAPTIADGDVIFIDTRHRVPSPPGIYALADEFGGVVVKRVEVISNPRDEQVRVRVSSDNTRYRDKELLLDEISILGRYICRVAF